MNQRRSPVLPAGQPTLRARAMLVTSNRAVDESRSIRGSRGSDSDPRSPSSPRHVLTIRGDSYRLREKRRSGVAKNHRTEQRASVTVPDQPELVSCSRRQAHFAPATPCPAACLTAAARDTSANQSRKLQSNRETTKGSVPRVVKGSTPRVAAHGGANPDGRLAVFWGPHLAGRLHCGRQHHPAGSVRHSADRLRS